MHLNIRFIKILNQLFHTGDFNSTFSMVSVLFLKYSLGVLFTTLHIKHDRCDIAHLMYHTHLIDTASLTYTATPQYAVVSKGYILTYIPRKTLVP